MTPTPEQLGAEVTLILKKEGGIWELYEGAPLIIAQAESFLENTGFCAAQTKDGLVYDRVAYRGWPGTEWRKYPEGLTEKVQALRESSNAKDSL